MATVTPTDTHPSSSSINAALEDFAFLSLLDFRSNKEATLLSLLPLPCTLGEGLRGVTLKRGELEEEPEELLSFLASDGCSKVCSPFRACNPSRRDRFESTRREERKIRKHTQKKKNNNNNKIRVKIEFHPDSSRGIPEKKNSTLVH